MSRDMKCPVRLGNLQGSEGNAFCILGRCRQSMKACKMNRQSQDEFHKAATAGDYEALLDTVLEWFQDLDDSIQQLRDERDE